MLDCAPCALFVYKIAEERAGRRAALFVVVVASRVSNLAMLGSSNVCCWSTTGFGKEVIWRVSFCGLKLSIWLFFLMAASASEVRAMAAATVRVFYAWASLPKSPSFMFGSFSSKRLRSFVSQEIRLLCLWLLSVVFGPLCAETFIWTAMSLLAWPSGVTDERAEPWCLFLLAFRVSCRALGRMARCDCLGCCSCYYITILSLACLYSLCLLLSSMVKSWFLKRSTLLSTLYSVQFNNLVIS